LGGERNISEAERALCKRVAVLLTELERREASFAAAGQVSDDALATYQMTVNTLRRTLATLGLSRRARDIGPPDPLRYAQQRYPDDTDEGWSSER
jgi:hypothetical protein